MNSCAHRAGSARCASAPARRDRKPISTFPDLGLAALIDRISQAVYILRVSENATSWEGPVDPLALAQALIRCPSVTPQDSGVLDVVEKALTSLGFVCERLTFGDDKESARVDNLYARRGAVGPNLCFAGHTDVVPVGDVDAWTKDPFGGDVVDGRLYGRGACDMKSAIAAFIAGSARVIERQENASISLLLTGDEEGPAVNGTLKVLESLRARGEAIDHCLVGEPTSSHAVGDTIKNGRRGSLNAVVTFRGTQGHVAYPNQTDNPMPRLLEALQRLTKQPLDDGTENFDPSNLEVTSIDVGNPATNVVPAAAAARFNIRFNDTRTSGQLSDWIRATLDAVHADLGGTYDLDIGVSGDAFHTPVGPFTDLLSQSVEDVTGKKPSLSTGGGTSDARFIKDYCPVAELGLVGTSMHKVDEYTPVTDIYALAKIYEAIVTRYVEANGQL